MVTSIKEALYIVIGQEETLDEKLCMLTEISLTSRQESVFQACETVRSELCDWSPTKSREQLLRDTKPAQFIIEDDTNQGLSEPT